MSNNEFYSIVDKVQHLLEPQLQEFGEIPVEQLWQQRGDIQPGELRDALRVLIERGRLILQSGPVGPSLKAACR